MNPRCMLLACAGLLTAAAALLADDWPQWRGPDRTDVSKEKGLLKAWPKGGPKLLWTYKEAGIGFSGFAIVGERLFTMGARSEEEYAICLDVKDNAKQLWATKLGPIFTFRGNYWGDGPRATPTVDGDFVYVLGGQGELACLKGVDGTVVWRKNLIKDFRGQMMEHAPPMNWGYTESPLIDGNKLICCPGGPDGTMMALDKKTGNLLWRTKELADQATHSSVVVADIGGVRQYVQTTYKGTDGGGVAGVAAADGKLLWYAPNKRYDIYAICPTPIVNGDLVYVTAGYSAGCNLFKITKDAAGKFSAVEQYSNQSRKVMENMHGGVVLVGEHLFGHSNNIGWTCQEFKTGKEVWSERNKLDGKGSLTYADGCFYLFSDEGELVLLKASAEGWDEKGRFSLPQLSKTRQTRPTHESAGVWTHPVVANGRLFLRDQEFIFCYAVKE
jgi:outer membrane protein assembly factor BamB